MGSPRNDLLVGDPKQLDSARADMRSRLDVAEGEILVLYAPTWRDTRSYGVGKYRFDGTIDLSELSRELPDEVVLAVRGHSNVVDRTSDESILDVSSLPDVTPLLAAIDILVTDYSTVTFDYALLSRPMVFFAYDLDEYRDSVRGFYIDYEANMPGPIVRSLLDLRDAIVHAIEGRPATQERSNDFVTRYCSLEDGKASQRATDWLYQSTRS